MRHPRSRSLGSLELFSHSEAVPRPRARLAPVGLPRPIDGESVRVPAPGLGPSVRPASRPELWLAIHLSQFVLDSLHGEVTALPGHPPVAVIDLEGDGKVVCACDAAAAAAGVSPGMALNSALALLPSLQTLPRDLRRERALLESVARIGIGYTPRVSLEPPDAVLLELRGSLRLFGGVRALHERLRAGLQSAGITARLALTPTPLASLWFARTGQEVALRRTDQLASRLAPLPLAVTRWPERSLQLLVTMGVRHLGDCLRLPRDGFARRFEPELLALLDRATGRLPEPRAAFCVREKFVARRDLEPELADTARLEVAIRPLLDELCAFLRQRGRGVTAIELRLRHRETDATRERLRFVRPTGDAAHIASLLHERLTRLALPEPVRSVRIASGPLVEMAEVPTELFATDRRASGAAVPQLVERLRARLGEDAVHGIRLVPEHRPEAAWEIGDIPLFPKQAGERGPGNRGMSPISRPLWLLAEPQPLAGDERPRCEGELAIEEGPERIESGWWDGRDVARDYYVVRNAAGVRLWVFRERRRQRDAAGRRGGWFLHGVFG